MLYHTVNQAGGIQAMALWLEASIHDRGLLLCTDGLGVRRFFEGIAGFGIPVAIVAPMLVGIGVAPATAVAAVAVGHAWAYPSATWDGVSNHDGHHRNGKLSAGRAGSRHPGNCLVCCAGWQ